MPPSSLAATSSFSAPAAPAAAIPEPSAPAALASKHRGRPRPAAASERWARPARAWLDLASERRGRPAAASERWARPAPAWPDLASEQGPFSACSVLALFGRVSSPSVGGSVLSQVISLMPVVSPPGPQSGNTGSTSCACSACSCCCASSACIFRWTTGATCRLSADGASGCSSDIFGIRQGGTAVLPGVEAQAHPTDA